MAGGQRIIDVRVGGGVVGVAADDGVTVAAGDGTGVAVGLGVGVKAELVATTTRRQEAKTDVPSLEIQESALRPLAMRRVGSPMATAYTLSGAISKSA
jgi:hypothetical protein